MAIQFFQTANFANTVTATSFVKSGGTSSQFLMADGSVSTGGSGVTLTNGVDNRLVTAASSSSINGESGLLFAGSYLEITPGDIASPLHVKRTGASTRQVNIFLSANDGSATSEGFLGIDSSSDLRYGASSSTSQNDKIFHDGYHPNADAWTTERTVTFSSGDVTGSFSIDGSSNVDAVNLTVANDSHTHDGRYYTETESDARFLKLSGGGSISGGVININTNTNTNTLNVSRGGSNSNQVMKVGVTDTVAVFNYIEDTTSEGNGNFGQYQFKLGGNDGETTVTGFTITKTGVSAPNLSGTNTGDQDLSGYALTSDVFSGSYADLTNVPSTFAPSAHNHDGTYLKLSGGTMTGDITMGGSGPGKIKSNTDLILQVDADNNTSGSAFKLLSGGGSTLFKIVENGNIDAHGVINFTGTATTTSVDRGLYWTGFDKEGTTDFTDNASVIHKTNTGGHSGSVLEIKSMNDASDGIAFTTHASSLLKHNGDAIFSEGHKPTWDEIESKPSTFTPSSHNHSASEITSGTLDNARLPDILYINDEVQIDGELALTEATGFRRYEGSVTSVSNSAYKTAFTVNGGNLASHVRFSVQGTTSSVVVSNLIDLSVNHHQDIMLEALSGVYTQLSVKVVSNNNEDFAVELKTNSANAATLYIEVIAYGGESVSFTNSHSYSGSTLEAALPPGKYIKGTGGDSGDLEIGGIFRGDGSGLTSISYNDLDNKPTIPTNYLTNNAFDQGVGLYLTGGSYNAGTDTATSPLVIDEEDFILTKDGGYLRRLIGKTSDSIHIGQSGTGLISSINFLPGTAGNTAVKVNGNPIFHEGHKPTWDEIESKPTTFAPSTHNHDSSYVNLSGDTMTGQLTTTKIATNHNSSQAAPRYDTSFYVAQSQHYYGQNGTQGMYLGESGNDIYIRGQLAIGGTAIQSGYGLTMTGHIDMNAYAINYLDQIHFNDNVRFYDDGNDNYLNFKWGDTGAGGIKMIDGSGHLNGYIYCDGTDQIGFLDADGTWAVRVDKDVTVDLRVNNSTRLACVTGGVNFQNGGTIVGEVTTAGLARFANDVVAYYSFSDQRLKTNIKPTTNNLDKILKLEPVEYTWKDGGREGKKEIGLIAQDVEKVVPEVVRENERLNDNTLYKQVDYEHLVSTLIGAIQEQQDQIAELKSEVTNLKSTMCKCKK